MPAGAAGYLDAPIRHGRWHWPAPTISGRDVLARLLYGFRLSMLFGLALPVDFLNHRRRSGAIQGYFGGWTDLI